MQKADYSKIASFYDKGRTLDDAIMDMWLEAITRYSKAKKNARLLDIGCGTGRFAIQIAEKLGYKVTGADASAEMLGKAQEKDPAHLITWEVQDAQNLAYPDESFDIVFASQILQHCTDRTKAIGEFKRVLKPSGALMLRGCVIEEIRGDAEATFFPETVPINEARILSLPQTLALLKNAGFINVTSEVFAQRSCRDGLELYDRMANKNASALTMIPQEAFERGLKRLYDYVQKHPDDPWLVDDKIRITAAWKAACEKG